MTNHSESNGSPENGPTAGDLGPTAYDSHGPEHQVTLRTPAELADAMPYLLGYRPEDSIVLVALHDRDGRGRFGGRARLGIPASADDWGCVARQLAHGLVTGSERRGARPEQMVAYLCQEPAKGESGRQVMERLRPLAQKLRVECGQLDVPVIEALCISGGRFWSYCCSNEACCPSEGLPMGLPGTSVLAAAATYAGLQVRGTLRELRARLQPWETMAALEQEIALDTASMALVPRILDDSGRAGVAEETLELAEGLMRRLALAPVVSGTLAADVRDDELLGHDEAAALILGLQDRATRDRAAEWMEGDEAAPALRLWRALARRCVGPYGEHAAAPLTLAGWVAWSSGDDLEAREALAMALGADPDYLFARLLHQACNENLDPESIRRCLRAERRVRVREDAAEAASVPSTVEANGRPLASRAVEGQEVSAGMRALEGQQTSAVARAVQSQETSADSGAAENREMPVASRALQSSEPAPLLDEAVRPKRRSRSGAAAGSRSRAARADGGRSTVSASRPRTSKTDTGRPGAARKEGTRPRASGNEPARHRESRPGSTHPGGDETGAQV